jgi:hypothetical protein
MGIIINFTNRTVHGFEFGFPVKIIELNETTIDFQGESDIGALLLTFWAR